MVVVVLGPHLQRVAITSSGKVSSKGLMANSAENRMVISRSAAREREVLVAAVGGAFGVGRVDAVAEVAVG